MMGEWRLAPLRESPVKRRGDLPEGALSQIVEIYDEAGNRIGLAHRYVNARGRPIPGRELLDPKVLVIDGQTYVLAGNDETPQDPAL